MKKISKITIILVGIMAMVLTLSSPMGLYANDSLIDASNYKENRERLEKEANRDAAGNYTTIDATTTKDYTYGVYGRIHIDGWNVEILSATVESDQYHTITFKADEFYNLPEVSTSGKDVRFANVQSYMTTGNSYSVNEDKTIGTLRFKPNPERDTYNGTPILVRLVGINQQHTGDQASYLSSYVFKDVRHSAIQFTGEEKNANISFQLEGSRTYLVRKNTDLKVYPTVNPWFKPIETTDVKTGVNSSNDFSNRYYIIKGSSRDSTGSQISYDATAFSVKVYNGHTRKWETKSMHDFYHEDQTITMPEITDPSIYYVGYRVNGFTVKTLEYEPKMANVNKFTPEKTVGLDYTIQTNAADYNRQWVSTGMDPTYDQNRESSLRHRAGNIFINATWVKIYNVSFVDYDGLNLSNQVVDKGTDAVAPADPYRDGYTFIGWDTPYVNVQDDLVITATYSENPKNEKVSVTFVDYDGTIISNQMIDKGSDAVEPVVSDREGYVFMGWDKAFTNVQTDLVVSAMYSENPQTEKVNVVFVDYNGTNLSNQVIEKGSDAIAPADPSREGFTFIGWDKTYTNVQTDLVVSAMYSENPKVDMVNVAFLDYDGTNLSNQQIVKGSDAIAPTDPSREGYTFTGWDKTFTNVQSDLVVVATYTPNAIVTPPTEIPPVETPNPPANVDTPIVNEIETTPEQVTPEQVTPEQVTPEQATPEQVTPEQVTPEQVNPEQENEQVEIEKQNTPKAKADTGSWALLNLIAAILTIIVTILLILSKHSKEDEKESDYTEKNLVVEYTRRRWTKVVSVLVSILAIIVFILTEDMSLPMMIIDKWTLLMAVIFLIQVVVFFVGRKWRDNDEDEENQNRTTTLEGAI